MYFHWLLYMVRSIIVVLNTRWWYVRNIASKIIMDRLKLRRLKHRQVPEQNADR